MESSSGNAKADRSNLQKSLFAFLVTLIFGFGGQAQSAGPRIVFWSTRDGNPEIHAMDPDGSNVVNLSQHPKSDKLPVWSPNGKKIAFMSSRDGENWEIFVMDADGRNQIQLTDTPIWVHNTGIAWSPDGTKIAFSSDRSEQPLPPNNTNQDVYVMDADGGNPQNLTRHPAADGPTCWSPDGTKIAFGTNRDGNEEVYVMDADGGNPQNLTQHRASDSAAHWSPDGTKIVFVSNREGNGEIYVMNASGGNPVNLTKNPAADGGARWSPDGKKLVFSSDRDDRNGEIYVMNADGSRVIRLTDNPSEDANGSWFDPLFAVSKKEKRLTLWAAIKRSQ